MNKPASTPNGASVVGFAEGVAGVTPPSSSTGRQGVFLTDVIVELGFAEKARVDEAEEAARVSGKTVEQLLLDKRVIDDDKLSLAIAERNGLDHVDLDRFEVDMKAADTVGQAEAIRCGAVPIAFAADGSSLIVAVQDSFDALAVRRIETATGVDVRLVIASVGAIKRLIDRLPEDDPAEAPEPEVPRITSQRELKVGGAEESGVEEKEDEEVSTAVEAPEDEEAPPEVPAEPPQVEAPRPDPGEREPSSFDGLSMDLGPLVMDRDQKGDGKRPEGARKPSKKLKKAAKREDRLTRELIETKGRVAELERRLEEVIDAADEATSTSEKLSALRRALDEGSF
jgi:MshEN domain